MEPISLIGAEEGEQFIEKKVSLSEETFSRFSVMKTPIVGNVANYEKIPFPPKYAGVY
jgi:hypothetical protein